MPRREGELSDGSFVSNGSTKHPTATSDAATTCISITPAPHPPQALFKEPVEPVQSIGADQLGPTPSLTSGLPQPQTVEGASSNAIARQLLVDEWQAYTVVSEWYGWLHFADPACEATYVPYVRMYMLIVGESTTLCTTLVMVILMFIEFGGFHRNTSEGLASPILLLAGVVIGIVVLVVVYWKRGLDRLTSHPPRLAFLAACLAQLLCVSFGCAFSRPSVIGNDATYYFVVICVAVTVSVSGVPWMRCVLYVVVLAVGNGVIAFTVNHGAIKITSLMAVLGVLFVTTLFLRWQEMTVRHRHRDVCVVKLASEVEVQQKDILQSALAAVIPAPLVQASITLWTIHKCSQLVHPVPRGVVAVATFVKCSVPQQDTLAMSRSQLQPSEASHEVVASTVRGGDAPQDVPLPHADKSSRGYSSGCWAIERGRARRACRGCGGEGAGGVAAWERHRGCDCGSVFRCCDGWDAAGELLHPR